MHLDIIATAQLNDEEAGALRALHAAVYTPTPRAEKTNMRREWALPQWSIMIRGVDGQLVSHVGVVTRLCLCDDKETLIGGIGGVKTHPSQRGKGYAGAGLRRAIEFLQGEMAVDMSLLFCGPQMRRYYRRFGFTSFVGDLLVRQDREKTLFPRDEVMVMPVMKPLPQCAVLDLCGLPW
ncbi:MAG: GNAT family N-acetyltransferase [Chloroflexi bacterium]|nr:GNAT family N-acetyltransferase [Chloroflexota bacterium]